LLMGIADQAWRILNPSQHPSVWMAQEINVHCARRT